MKNKIGKIVGGDEYQLFMPDGRDAMIMIDCPLCGGNCKQKEKKEVGVIQFSCGAFHQSFCVGEGLQQSMGRKERNQLCNLIFEHCLHNQNREYFYDTGISEYALFHYEIFVNLKTLMKQYPESILDKIDRILQNLAVLYPEVGEQITINEELSRAFFAEKQIKVGVPDG